MSVVKEYLTDETKIRIHDDYIGTEEKTKIRELIISLIINKVKKNVLKLKWDIIDDKILLCW